MGRVTGNAVVRVVVRRLALAVPLLFVVSALTFVLISVTPGDAASQVLGPEASPSQLAALRHQLGLDKPLYEQYWRWLHHALNGDLGTSLFGGTVTHIIGQRYPITLSLILLSFVVIVVVGVSLGVFSAVRGGILGRFVDGISLVGFALPPFWVGAVLISIFAVKLHWLPAVSYVPLAQSATDWFRSLIMPVASLALFFVALMAKQTREAMMDVLASEHVRMSWANGIPARFIFFRLALKNASIRVVTIAGIQTIGLLGGTIFVEQVFALPGLGTLLTNSALSGDLPVVQGVVVVFTLVVVVVNLVVDLTFSLLDPRVRTS